MNDADAGIAETQPGHDQRRTGPYYLSDGEHEPSPVWAELQAGPDQREERSCMSVLGRS